MKLHDFVKDIELHRIQHKLTINEVSKAAGIHPNTYDNFRKYNVTMDTFIRICIALKMDIHITKVEPK